MQPQSGAKHTVGNLAACTVAKWPHEHVGCVFTAERCALCTSNLGRLFAEKSVRFAMNFGLFGLCFAGCVVRALFAARADALAAVRS